MHRAIHPFVKLAPIVVASAALIWLAGTPAHASHLGESLTTDQQLVSVNNQFLGALAAWEKLPPSLKSSNLANLVGLAQTRQQLMIALLQLDPKVAAARALPQSIRARMPSQVAAFVEETVRVQGNGAVHVSDNFAGGTSKSVFKLLGNAGSTPQNVYMADASGSERDLHKLAGKKLTFAALRIGDNLLLLDKKQVQAQPQAAGSTTASGSVQATTSTVQGDQKTLSILVNFSDKALSCTAADVGSRVFGATGATVNNIFKTDSRGLVTFSGNAVGPYTINYASTGSCDYNGWASAAEAAAKAAGVDPTQYARVNYVTPSNGSCGWSGLAYMPGRQSWVQSCSSTGIYAHELGHNLSLHHAATPTAEYGDGSDPMGGAAAIGHNGANKVMAGWQPAGTVLDVSNAGSFNVTNVSDNSVSGTAQVLRMVKADTAEFYYVSLREATGVDAGLGASFVNTVSVHRATGNLPTKTYLLQVLTAGQSFSDATNGITITNQGASGGVATVGVSMGGGVCSRASPTVAVSPASQTGSAGATLSYSVSVTNTNSSACGSSTFSIGQALPSGFSGSLSSTSLALGSGSSGSVTWTTTSAATLANGSYTLDANATDTANSAYTTTAHASYTVYSNVTPPTVAVTSPANGAVLSGGHPVSISASATDDGGIQAVEIYIDGVLLARDTGAPYSANWNIRKVAKGLHTIKARAIDNAGLMAEQSISVTVN